MRGRIACLNTDLSEKMKAIEGLLPELHSLHRDEGMATMGESANEEQKAAGAPAMASRAAQGSGDSCLWITDVREGSPAADAGLLLGDAIVSFGSFVPNPEMTL